MLYAFLKILNRNSFYGFNLLLKYYPIIDKNIFIKYYNQIYQGKSFLSRKSSGTTGELLTIPHNRQACQKNYAFWLYLRSFENIYRGDLVIMFAGHKVYPAQQDTLPFWVMDCKENQLLFSSYYLSFKNMPFYMHKLNVFKLALIHGCPSSIYLLAKNTLKNDISFQFRPRMIITASEKTLDFERNAIKKALNCKLYIRCGYTDFGEHITECPKGRLHLQPYHSYVRILDNKNDDVTPGEEGVIGASHFTNTAFPLVNYNPKDVVRLSRDQIGDCNKGGTIVDYIHGRVEDYILTSDGRWVGRLDHLFKSTKNIRNAQIEQYQQGEIIIRIQRDEKYSLENEKIIIREVIGRLGTNIKIDFDYVPEIKRDDNGKYRFIIQNIPLNQ